MAKLAIRATSDRSTRERVTVGNDTVNIEVFEGNKHTFTILVHSDGVNVYDETSIYTYEGLPTYETIHFIKKQGKIS